VEKDQHSCENILMDKIKFGRSL